MLPDGRATENQHQRTISQVFITSKYSVHKYSVEKMNSDKLVGRVASSKLFLFFHICSKVLVTFFNMPNS